MWESSYLVRWVRWLRERLMPLPPDYKGPRLPNQEEADALEDAMRARVPPPKHVGTPPPRPQPLEIEEARRARQAPQAPAPSAPPQEYIRPQPPVVPPPVASPRPTAEPVPGSPTPLVPDTGVDDRFAVDVEWNEDAELFRVIITANIGQFTGFGTTRQQAMTEAIIRYEQEVETPRCPTCQQPWPAHLPYPEGDQ